MSKNSFRKTLIILCAAFLSLSLSAQPWMRGSKVVSDSLYSENLSCYRTYTVFLPDGYDKSGESYPVLYLLHGMGGTDKGWIRGENLKPVLDLLTQSGESVPMIVVCPNAGGPVDKGFKNGYFNMKDWAYEDFFYKEFVPFIEGKYRIKADKAHRAIGGLSMGGGGAVSYAQRHPGMFCAAYAMSALVNIPKGAEHPTPDPDDMMSTLTRSVIEHSCIKYVEEADDATKQNLRSVKWFVDCGDDDFLLDRNLEFYRAMRSAGVPCELRVRDGGHTSEYWHTALYTCLPFVSRVFGK